MKGNREVMTARELARRIKVPHSTVSQWLQKGQIPGAKSENVGDYKIWVIPVEVVSTYPGWRPKRGRPKGTTKKSTKKAKKAAK
jgi:DNA-binding transcriptional ArsR family regulator